MPGFSGKKILERLKRSSDLKQRWFPGIPGRNSKFRLCYRVAHMPSFSGKKIKMIE